MTIQDWVSTRHSLHIPINKGYPPGNSLHGDLYGLVLHVNVSGSNSPGTSDSYFEAGPPTNQFNVCPNVQIYKTPVDGFIIHQYLPFSYRPWCQEAGNQNYNAVETGGDPDEPLNNDQLDAVGRVMAIHHKHFGVPLQLANTPGERGLGTHAMGGASWGGHPCPGTIRTLQRTAILDIANEYIKRWK